MKLTKSQPINFSKNKVFKYEETIGEKRAKKLTGKPIDFCFYEDKRKKKWVMRV